MTASTVRVEHVYSDNLHERIDYSPTDDYMATVGILDDDPGNVERYANTLARGGYRCVGISVSGPVPPTQQEKQAFTRRVIDAGLDVAVVDAGLGRLNGIELVEKLRDEGILTVLITGNIQTGDTADVADEFLYKPLLPQTLKRTVARMLGFPTEEQ